MSGTDGSCSRPALLARIAPAVLIVAAVLVAHGPGLGNGFVWDDGVIILDNPDTRNPSRIGAVLLSADVRHPYYRPLNRASYLVDHMVFGMSPRGFHAVNIALQVGCALLLYSLALRLYLGRAGALTAAILLSVHPIGVEVVGFVTARNNLFALLFSLAALILFIDAERRDSLRFAALSGLAFFLGLLSKEPAAMVLPLLGAVLWLPGVRTRPPDWRRLRLLTPHAAACVVYAALRTVSIGGLVASGEASGALAGGVLHRLALNYYTVPKYLVLLLFPRDLTTYHVVPEAPLPTLLWPLAVWVALGLGVVLLLRHRTPATTVGLLWFALALVPILNLVSLPTSTVIAERYFFLPAVGLWLIAGATVDRAWRLPSLRAPVAIAGCLVVSALAARSFVRTLDWRNNLSLDRAAVAVEPRSAAAHLNLGSSLQSQGDIAGAWREWEEATRLAPTNAAAWAAMGLQAQREGDAPKAEKLLRGALRLDLRHVVAWMGLGNILDDAGDSERARAEWEAVLRIDPRHTGALVQLGTSWAMRGDLSRAERYFRDALAVDPALPEALFDMGKLSEQAGRPLEAVTFYRRYLSVTGADQQAARVAADRIRLLMPASPR
jgi:Flp pilus assembly protein TadD